MKYDTTKYTPPFRVGRNQRKAVLDSTGREVIFFKDSEEQAQLYCDYLNENIESSKINLKQLEKNLDDALEKETTESITNWLLENRKTMNQLDLDYQNLLRDILENGVQKMDRTGTGTLSVFGRQIRHKMSDGFPLLTTKKMAWKTMVTELLWFLRGETNIKFLLDYDCHIWDGDAYKNWCKQFEVDPNNFNDEEVAKGYGDQCWGYPILDHVKPTSKEYKRGQINAYLEGKADKPFFYLTQQEFINKIKTDDEFAKKWGELGPIYGAQWRNWDVAKILTIEKGRIENSIGTEWGSWERKPIDQIANLINDLRTNPDSRRLLVSAWNVGELDQMTLPPCHYGFQVYTRELNINERILIAEKSTEIIPGFDSHFDGDEDVHRVLDTWNVPTRAISLMWAQRSVDAPLGLPFNIASYGLLLTMIADEVNMVPDELIGNLGDCHIYLNQIEGVKEQIGRELTDEERYDIWFTNNYETGMERFFNPEKLPDFENSYYTPTPKRTREPFPLPTVKVQDGIYCSSVNDVLLENYQSQPPIKFPLSN